MKAHLLVASLAGLVGCTDEEDLGTSPRAPIPYITLAHAERGGNDLVHADDTYVYWGSFNVNAKLGRVPVTGGAMETIAHVRVEDFRMDDDFVYAMQGHELIRIAKADGTIETLATTTAEFTGLLAVVDDWVYLGEGHVDPARPWTGTTTLWRMHTTGGVREDLDTPPNSSFGAFAAVPTALSWADSDGSVWSMPAEGSATRVLASMGTSVWANADDLFIATNPPHSSTPPPEPMYPLEVLKYHFEDGSMLDLGGADGVPIAYLAPARATPTGVVGIERHYQSTGPDVDYAIVFYPSDGSGRRVVYNDIPETWGDDQPDFAPDGSAMFWVDAESGDVNRLDLVLSLE